jgi:hypothetical protein
MRFSITSFVLFASAATVAVGQDQRFLNQARGGFFGPSNARPAVGRAIHEPFVEPVTAAKIRTAIEDAVTYLRSLQTPDGSIPDSYEAGGSTGLAVLAMLAAGADPAADDAVKNALNALAKLEPNNTYVRAIRANVWEYALRKVPYDDRIRKLLKDDYEWLLAALGNKEGWRYQKESTDWDNSCTQYGVLGIWAAARAGFAPGDKFWSTMSKHFRECQNADGGWGYTRGGGSTPNMATAGLASMFLVFDMYHAKTCYTNDDPRTFATGEAADVLASIERGMTWLGRAQGNKEDGYYLYGIERTGVASGRDTIGGEDWFARGALAVLQAQRRDGSIPLGHWGGPAIGTSFCALFLVYGGAPVAFNKLQYGDGQDWNLNPRDLANLTKSLWSAYERPLNWQTVSLDLPAAEIEAPILFLSGSRAAKFSEEQMLKLRDYLLGGGLILAEPSDHSEAFCRSMEELVQQMFPASDFPGHRLEPLPANHDIYTVIKQTWTRPPRLRGVSDGSRTIFLLSDEYLSADWQMDRSDSDAYKLATNLLFYATDLGELEGKFASLLPATPPVPPRARSLTVARVRHVGDASQPRDWDAAAVCWQKLAPYVRHVTGCELKEAPPVTLGKDALDGLQVLHITGRAALKFTADERAVLKKFGESGGTVLVDPYAGSFAFATARAELEAMFGNLHPLKPDHILAEGRFEGGVDLSTGVRFKLAARQLLRGRGEEPQGQKLFVASVGRRPAVLFSEFDLVAAAADIPNYRSLGYKPDSARKILGNLLGYLAVD